MSTVKRYSTTPEVVEAARLDKDNEQELARWCGGQSSNEQTPDGVEDYLKVPTIKGVLKAYRGMYVIKNIETGQFDVLTEGQFVARKFHEVGLRQDGINVRGSITVPNPAEPQILVNKRDNYSVGDRYLDHAGYMG